MTEKLLRNLRKKWRTEATKQRKLADRLYERRAVESGGKSVGVYIGLEQAASDLDKLIRSLEWKGKHDAR